MQKLKRGFAMCLLSPCGNICFNAQLKKDFLCYLVDYGSCGGSCMPQSSSTHYSNITFIRIFHEL